MEDWKVRLLVEQKELKEKLVKLVAFINSEEYYQLSDNNRLLLKDQKIAMELYLNVLNMRVFEDVDDESEITEEEAFEIITGQSYEED